MTITDNNSFITECQHNCPKLFLNTPRNGHITNNLPKSYIEHTENVNITHIYCSANEKSLLSVRNGLCLTWGTGSVYDNLSYLNTRLKIRFYLLQLLSGSMLQRHY